MSLKNEIIRIYTENTDYSSPRQAMNQSSSLITLSSDLYTDSTRFIYELLQNADDSAKDSERVEIRIKLFEDTLVFAHNGSPFSKRDIDGICNINNGTKRNDITKTGYKGIGFKSVFGQSNQVTIYSDNEYFCFDSNYDFPWKWTISREDWERENDRKFVFPWQIIPIYKDVEEINDEINRFIKSNNVNVATIIKIKNPVEVTNAINNISKNLNSFLFLKNIREIAFDCIDKRKIQIMRDDNVTTLFINNKSVSKWLVNRTVLSVPDHVKSVLKEERNIPEKLLSVNSIELFLAAKIVKEEIVRLSENESLLYSYLPTEEKKYKFPVLVNSSFITTANRESLHNDSKWNKWIFEMIPIELFRWISKLVSSQHQTQAYSLIPNYVRGDSLSESFNNGITISLKNVPFVLSKENKIVKIEDSIVDFTCLSEKEFVGSKPIEAFLSSRVTNSRNSPKEYAVSYEFFPEFKKLGATSFEWNDMKDFLNSEYSAVLNVPNNNIEFIRYLKKRNELENDKYVPSTMIGELPFVLDHKNNLSYAHHVCFPTPNDQNWSDLDNVLSFVHVDLQNWLLEDAITRQWLESHGVEEKTDITYITQIILPDIDNYINEKNALLVITELFNHFMKGFLNEAITNKLSDIKLLTKDNSLVPANQCYFSNFYKPRLEIEDTLEENIFVSEQYCKNSLQKDEWKRFFKTLGVHEGISKMQFSSDIASLQQMGFSKLYFSEDDKKFAPFLTVFTADFFLEISTLRYLNFVESNFDFSVRFWNDYIENNTPEELLSPANALWGLKNRRGREIGDKVTNYIPWYINVIPCIPTLLGVNMIANDIFLNDDIIKKISGNYLPVFSGPELSSDWKSFFKFKTELNVSDYLRILSSISQDTTENKLVNNGNIDRIQLIYSTLLNQCANWSDDEISTIKAWADKECLLDTKMQFISSNALKHYADGNESDFQEQYKFIMLNAENKTHKNLFTFLECFNIGVLRQSEFDLVYDHVQSCTDMERKLAIGIQYLKYWIKHENSFEEVGVSIDSVDEKINYLSVYESDKLEITYKQLSFVKKVYVHFDQSNLYVSKPWNSNVTLINLSSLLCRYLGLAGYEKKLDFLLRSSNSEINDYFIQEGIVIPHELASLEDSEKNLEFNSVKSFAEIENAVSQKGIDLEYFHLSSSDYDKLKYVEGLIERAVKNVINHLKQLPEYDCKQYYIIAKSIIGGISKNGNEITIVARPSDNGQVLLYHTSEFDVLDYVDAELWCENGVDLPKQITLGQLLKKTGINRIPVEEINSKKVSYEELASVPRSDIYDFFVVPHTPQKIASIIASFANTNGGKFVFGIKENHEINHEIVGLSFDYPVVNIVKKAISLLSPIPKVKYDWLIINKKNVFIVEVEKSQDEVIYDNKKYVRKNGKVKLINDDSAPRIIINDSKIDKTIALIIAIEEYAPRKENRIPNVKYALNDANRFKNTLINSMAVSEDNIYLLTNESALKSTIEYDFQGLFHSLTEDDRFIFYFVGHGFHNGITNYLSTYDMHQHNIPETGVSLRRILLDPLQKSKCKNALIFIDACATSFIDENGRNIISSFDEDELEVLTTQFPKYSIFLSCHPGQSSYSSDNLENGIWTYYLTKALSGKIPEVLRNRYITDRLLGDYLAKNVSEHTRQELGYEQNPKVIYDSSNENIIIKIE